MKMNYSCLFAFFLTITSLCNAAVFEPLKEDCVLGADGVNECNPVDLLRTSTRNKAPCAKSDIRCWNKMVREYTNAVRTKHGVKHMLKLGPRRQLMNANKHAIRLSKWGKLKHQILPQATKEVKCKRWIGGENLAYNYEHADIARACVNQWINSKGHFDNLVRDWFREVVTGFHFDKDGRVYCVQTFGLFYSTGTIGPDTGKDCEPVA